PPPAARRRRLVLVSCQPRGGKVASPLPLCRRRRPCPPPSTRRRVGTEPNASVQVNRTATTKRVSSSPVDNYSASDRRASFYLTTLQVVFIILLTTDFRQHLDAMALSMYQDTTPTTGAGAMKPRDSPMEFSLGPGLGSPGGLASLGGPGGLQGGLPQGLHPLLAAQSSLMSLGLPGLPQGLPPGLPSGLPQGLHQGLSSSLLAAGLFPPLFGWPASPQSPPPALGANNNLNGSKQLKAASRKRPMNNNNTSTNNNNEVTSTSSIKRTAAAARKRPAPRRASPESPDLTAVSVLPPPPPPPLSPPTSGSSPQSSGSGDAKAEQALGALQGRDKQYSDEEEHPLFGAHLTPPSSARKVRGQERLKPSSGRTGPLHLPRHPRASPSDLPEQTEPEDLSVRRDHRVVIMREPSRSPATTSLPASSPRSVPLEPWSGSDHLDHDAVEYDDEEEDDDDLVDATFLNQRHRHQLANV
ncbi:hypothetical protein FOCC_FOCC001652, partial [Frankliniella occidentalis]